MIDHNPRIDESAEKDIRAYFGSSGAGKTHAIKKDLASMKAERVLVYDPEGAFNATEGYFCTNDRQDYYQRARKSGPIKLCYQGSGRPDFDWWGRLIFALADSRRPSVIVVDELAGVTTTAKAPESWHQILTRARKYRGAVLAGAQSPTEIDKKLMRQKQKMFIGYLERPADHKYMSDETGIDVEIIAALKPAPNYDHILYKGRGQFSVVTQ